jgi:hypothetical protein
MANVPLHGPWCVMERERGTVTISQIENDRYQVSSRGAIDADRFVQGHDAAQRVAHELAEQLGPSIIPPARTWPMHKDRHRLSR